MLPIVNSLTHDKYNVFNFKLKFFIIIISVLRVGNNNVHNLRYIVIK